ncbi:Arylsulfatase A [Neorhodopirellula lusitana]|uniref:Arylsulfatase A n=1 Tax=Neorhodopirellula lusitana TaxID=445327 RepID=A0ABY1PQW4_9BACT|nr:sulfatase-like hydrolase/transferase [Neorhodopirellula lusitana]SMP42255.1 Arylsulfatase A [Neorhodopirellula lusitana]
MIRRFHLTTISIVLLTIVFQSLAWAAEPANRPNIILMMADDLGYGDTGFNGNPIIQTPHLDSLAQQGVKLTHFYSGNSVCSPTRGTCLTGRHHDRYGIYTANAGHLPSQEITLARALKSKGYTTGHFGKWHLGTLSKTESSKGKNRKPEINYAPPWERDYDASFVTESAVSTWNPGLGKRAVRNPFYENGVPVDGNDESLKGGAARVVVDRAAPFMKNAIDQGKPFFAVVWFHAPHEDIQAGPDYLKKYEGHGAAAHFYGCITEMDEQVGRITGMLQAANVAENTLIFFCSDNGPEGKQAGGRRMGTTDGLRGRKRALYDGGVRVPAFAFWPGKIPAGTQSDSILSTLDYFPTIQNIVGYDMPDDRPLDGQDAMPALTGQAAKRHTDIHFRYAAGESSIIRDHYKFLLPRRELYDISHDRAEKNNIAAQKPEVAERLERDLIAFFDDVQRSQSGGDYDDPTYKPYSAWKPLKTTPKSAKPKRSN